MVKRTIPFPALSMDPWPNPGYIQDNLFALANCFFLARLFSLYSANEVFPPKSFELKNINLQPKIEH